MNSVNCASLMDKCVGNPDPTLETFSLNRSHLSLCLSLHVDKEASGLEIFNLVLCCVCVCVSVKDACTFQGKPAFPVLRFLPIGKMPF